MTKRDNTENADLTLVPVKHEAGGKCSKDYDGGFSLLEKTKTDSGPALSPNVASRKRHDFQDFTCG